MIKEFKIGKFYYIKKEYAVEVRKIVKETYRTGRNFVELLIESPSKCVVKGAYPCDCSFYNEFDDSKIHRCFIDFLPFIDEYVPNPYVQEEMEL